MERAPGSGQVEVQNAALLEAGGNRRCTNHGEEWDQLPEECRARRKLGLLAHQMRHEENGACDEFEEIEEQAGDQHRPTGAQSVAAQKDPFHTA